MSPSEREGAGNAGCLAHPQPRVRWKKAHELVATGTPKHSGIPCAMVLTAYLRALPGVPGFFATVARADHRLARLDPSVGGSGPHDFAVRPACARPAQPTQRPSHPAPNVRDDRETPLLCARDAQIKATDLPDGASVCGCDRLTRRAKRAWLWCGFCAAAQAA